MGLFLYSWTVRAIAAPLGVLILLGSILATPVRAHDEIEIGVTAAGKLTFGGHLHMPFQVPLSLYPGLTGHSYGDLLFTARALPAEAGLLPVSSAAYLSLVLVSSDPALKMYDSNGTLQIPVGQSFDLGYPSFSTTPVFNLPPGTASGTIHSAQFRLHDFYGYHADSDPFALTFQAVPEPGLVSTFILVAIWLGLIRRPRPQPVRC